MENKKRNPNHPLKTLKRLWLVMWDNFHTQLLIVLFLILISSVANVSGSLFLKVVIDQYILPILKSGSRDFSGLLLAIGKMGGLYLAGVFATLAFNWMMVRISQGTQKKIRDDMFSHMESLPIGYFDSRTQGDIMSHYTNDIDTLRQMISVSVPNLLAALFTFLAIFVAMFSVNIPLTLFVAVAVTLMLLAIRWISNRSGKYFGLQQKSLGELNGFIEERLHGLKVVKIFNHEKETIAGFDTLNEQLKSAANTANSYANTLMPLMMNLLNLQYVLIAVLGGMLILHHHAMAAMTLGGLASFLQLSRSLNMPISIVSQQINFVIMALAGAGRIFNLLDEAPEDDRGNTTLINVTLAGGEIKESRERTGHWAWKQPQKQGPARLTRLIGDVRFEDVDFGYQPDHLVLHDISLYAEPGQKVAFVGSTGAGKTTITNLINRFYEIKTGKILYDGINISDIKKDSLRRSLGMVLQDTHLFTGTIRENIRYGKLDATDEDVMKAAELANAVHFIEILPQGFDTMITEDGEGLSQGQRQLIAIARAAIADPPVMILDEATSSIDTRTESLVQAGMDRLMEGRTVFVIAHRLSTIQNADVIMVMEHGRIIERGTHEQLIKEHGMYYQLYTGKTELS